MDSKQKEINLYNVHDNLSGTISGEMNNVLRIIAESLDNRK